MAADYSFFKTLTVIDTGRNRQPKSNTPEGVTLRVMKNGRVYPSVDLVKKFNLEYKNQQEDAGNGIDIVDTKKWAILAEHPRAILFGITPKDKSKVDLFGSCRYDEDGTPKSSVMSQGTVDENLLALVKEFGWLKDDQTYVDLKVLEDYRFATQDGIANIPKTISRGEKAGEQTYIRRESTNFYPVVPTDLESIVTAVATQQTEVEQTVTN